MSSRPLDLSLILACYNEEPVFEPSLQRIFEILELSTLSYEIIFVDDGSRDRTRTLIDDLIKANPQRALRSIFHERNVGRGGAVADGIRAARGEITGYIDIDLEVDALYIPACVLAIRRGADIAIGQRNYLFQARSLDRWVLSKGYHWLSQKLIGMPLLDTESGYKFFRRESILPVLDEIQDQRWFWDTEVMVRSARRGLKIQALPVLFIRRYDKRSSVNDLKDTFEYLTNLWRFRRELK